MNWLGLDIGGANLKVADGRGYAQSVAFPLWRQSDELPQAVRTLIAEAPSSDHLAVTMTGELADCFDDKAAGVQFILHAVAQAAGGRHTRVYTVDGKFLTPAVANQRPLEVAAANWHALARFVGRVAPSGPALLLDVGSTTGDIIPLLDGRPVATGRTDTERLLAHELIYTGVERSPVCALATVLPFRGRMCSVAQEVFATTRDVYVILGDLPEEPTDTQTADGRPATKGASRARLGRMLCSDRTEFNHKDAVEMARAVAELQAARVHEAVQHVIARQPQPPETIILTGHGEFLGERVVERLSGDLTIVSLSRRLGPVVSRCATAHALAILATEGTQP